MVQIKRSFKATNSGDTGNSPIFAIIAGAERDLAESRLGIPTSKFWAIEPCKTSLAS